MKFMKIMSNSTGNGQKTQKSAESLLRNGWKGVRQTITLRYKGRTGVKILSKSALTVVKST